MPFFRLSVSVSVAAKAALLAMLASSSVHAASLSEGFDTVLPAGWTAINNSVPLGTTNWFQGNNLAFDAFSGAPTSYIGANFNAGAGTATISDWLITPTLSFSNGDVLSFYTRTVTLSPPVFPDRLEVRFSSVGGTNVGATSASVGDFTTLLLTVNPGLTAAGYPDVWTNFSAAITGLGGPTNGAIAFRYFVTNGGPDGANSNYIGIDSVTITPVPEPATYLMMALGLTAVGLRRLRRSRA